MNFPLVEAFTKLPSVVYQNFLRKFWCTAIAYDPNPPTDDSEVRPLKAYLIKFLVMNVKNPLTLDFKTFVESTKLDYAKGTYVSHPSPEVLGENYSSTEQVNSIQQLFSYCILTGTEVHIEEIIYSDLITSLTNKSRKRYVSYPKFVSCALSVLLGPDYTQDESFGSSPTILSNSNFSKYPSKVTPIALTDFMVTVNNRKHSVNPLPFTVKKKKGKSQTGKKYDPKHSVGNIQPIDMGLPSTVSDEGTAKTTLLSEGPRKDKDSDELKPPADMEPQTNPVVDPLGTDAKYQVDQTQSARLSPELKKYDNILPLTERYYKENVDAAMNSFDKNSITRSDLLNALNEVFETHKAIQDAVKEDRVLNKKDKSLASIAWNFGPRMTAIKSSQVPIRTEVSSLRQDTSYIKSMMIEIFMPSKVSLQPPQADDTKKLEYEKAKEEPKYTVTISTVKPTETQPITTIISISQTKSSQPPKRTDKGKKIATDDVESLVKLVPALRVVREDPDEPIKVSYMINGKMYHLTNDEINEHLEKEDKIKKAREEAKGLAMTKTELIKIVQEEAEKIGINPKKVINVKAGEKFKKLRMLRCKFTRGNTLIKFKVLEYAHVINNYTAGYM
nr:hypothetical protein [Tanacetum cinerariifolium]